MPATVGRRSSTLASFYRYFPVEVVLERNPAAMSRGSRPGVDTGGRVPHADSPTLSSMATLFTVAPPAERRSFRRAEVAGYGQHSSDDRPEWQS